MKQRQPPLLVEGSGAFGEQPLADRDVAEQAPLLGETELGAIRELARLADVVHERGGEQQVQAQPGVELAELVGERRNRNRVLEQAPQVGVVAGPRARGGAKLGAEPLGPVNPIWAKAPAEDKARSAKAESRVKVRTDSIGAVFLRSWGDCKAGCSRPEMPRPFGLLGFPLGWAKG